MCESCKLITELCNTPPHKAPQLCIVEIHSHLKSKKMNTTELKGNWTEQKGKLKMKFAILTDNDLMFTQGKKEEMLGKLQIKLGKTKEELRKIIAAL
jgi:uncharacterized protein YjbJ (UPF0337 family)